MDRALGLGDRIKRANWLLLGLGCVLALAGVLSVGAASQGGGIRFGAVQMKWFAVGVSLCLLTLSVPYRRIVALRYFWYAVGLVALALCLVIGRGPNVARWIQIGSFRAQPSEIMKVIMVIVLAGYLRYGRSYREMSGLVRPILLTMIPIALIFKQPDLGTAVLLLPVLLVMLYVAGARRRHLIGIVVAGILGAAILVATGMIKEYQLKRVYSFLMQSQENQVLLRGDGHQVYHSKIVVGSSSFTGNGTGESVRDAVRFLPERHSDFIFPVFVSAFGLSGATLLFLVYLIFVGLLLRTAIHVREPSGRLLAVGVATLFACQSVINLAMTIGLLPIVGMPLPFLSYGGSSMLTSFIALGLVLNVGADHPVEFGRGDFD